MKLTETNLQLFIEALRLRVESIGYDKLGERTTICGRTIRRMFRPNSMPTLKSVLDVTEALELDIDVDAVWDLDIDEAS